MEQRWPGPTTDARDDAKVTAPFDGAQEHVAAVLPPSSHYVRAVRLFTAAAVSGMDVEQLQDLRLLIDECWSSMLQVTTGEVHLELWISPGRCRAVMAADWSGAHVEMDPMRAVIVGAIAEVHRFGRVGDRVEFEFVYQVPS